MLAAVGLRERGEVLGGSLRCEELDVEQTHEEKQPNPKNQQQEAQACPADELLQVDELVPSRRPGNRHQPDLTRKSGIRESGIGNKHFLLMPDT